jgi:hypothetical protein
VSNGQYPRVEYYTFSTTIRQTETDVLQLLLCMLDTIIALKFAIALHNLVAMIFTVSFDIIIERAVGNEPYYLIKKKTFNNYNIIQ